MRTTSIPRANSFDKKAMAGARLDGAGPRRSFCYSDAGIERMGIGLRKGCGVASTRTNRKEGLGGTEEGPKTRSGVAGRFP